MWVSPFFQPVVCEVRVGIALPTLILKSSPVTVRGALDTVTVLEIGVAPYIFVVPGAYPVRVIVPAFLILAIVPVRTVTKSPFPEP